MTLSYAPEAAGQCGTVVMHASARSKLMLASDRWDPRRGPGGWVAALSPNCTELAGVSRYMIQVWRRLRSCVRVFEQDLTAKPCAVSARGDGDPVGLVHVNSPSHQPSIIIAKTSTLSPYTLNPKP